MKPTIDKTKFGSITIEGEKFAYDVLIRLAGWVNYLLEQMKMEAQKDRKDAVYESMLLELQETLETRIEGGKW